MFLCVSLNILDFIFGTQLTPQVSDVVQSHCYPAATKMFAFVAGMYFCSFISAGMNIVLELFEDCYACTVCTQKNCNIMV
jgi:hypothetical protein